MSAGGLLNDILRNERLTSGLGDAEARMLIEWMVGRVETFERQDASGEELERNVQALCRRGRAIARFVWLWCDRRQRAAAMQLAASERFAWPLPVDRNIDPCELMATICNWEGELEDQRREVA